MPTYLAALERDAYLHITGELPPSVGERNSAAVMTEDKVRAIRAAHDAGADLAGLARAFDIHVRTARHIVQRTSWRHVA